jgi:16S rRNA (guanine966-N2)-methyltransferase
MRIVGGQFKGRSLQAPAARDIRPTSDRLRETLFNILTHWHGADVVTGARVIDLFAGTGALGLEALSRGARFALFVDEGAEARGLIRENVISLGVAGITRIFRRDATRLGQAQDDPFTLAFLDPPYGKALGTAALRSLAEGGWLAPGALVIVEEAASAVVEGPASLTLVDTRKQGDTQLCFFASATP